MYKPGFRINSRILNLIDECSSLRAWIETAATKVSWLPFLQSEARIAATHSSTYIEGNPLSISQVEAIAQGQKLQFPQKYEREVSNYIKAIFWIEKHSRFPINEKSIKKLHILLMKDLMTVNKCGEYKEKQNYVINEKGIKIYTPPPPSQTQKMVKELLDWLNSSESKNLHSILVCAIFHHRFVSIHPFTDGNGRLSRVLGSWILYNRGFDTKHILCLDDYFASDRKKYYLKIQQTRELDEDLTYWIEYVAEGIVYTLKNTIKRIENLQISPKFKLALTQKQEELLRILRNHPIITASELKIFLKVSRARINQIISPLIKNGIILKEGKSRATRYKLNLRSPR